MGRLPLRVWLPAVAASVGEPCRFHDLRHTRTALLVAQGEHLEVIPACPGHGFIGTTRVVCGHPLQGLGRVAVDTVGRALSKRAVGLVWGGEVVALPGSRTPLISKRFLRGPGWIRTSDLILIRDAL